MVRIGFIFGVIVGMIAGFLIGFFRLPLMLTIAGVSLSPVISSTLAGGILGILIGFIIRVKPKGKQLL